MNNYIKAFLIGVALTLAIFGGRKLYTAGYEEAKRYYKTLPIKIEYDTLSLKDTIWVPKFYARNVPGKVNLDSLYAYWKSQQTDPPEGEHTVYEASTETVYEDSTLIAWIKYHSRLPLDPGGYFTTDFRYREKTITKTDALQPITATNERLGIGIHLSAGYGFYRQKPDLMLGIGIHYRIF